MAVIKSGQTGGQDDKYCFMQIMNILYWMDGLNVPQKFYDADTGSEKWGIATPTFTPTITPTGSGSFSATYGYGYAFVFYNNKRPGTMSYYLTATNTGAFSSKSHVALSGWGGSFDDDQVTHVRIYRTRDGGTEYLYLTDVAEGTTSYNDSTADDSLGTVMPTHLGPPPPCTRYCFADHNRAFVLGDRPYTDGTATVSQGSGNVTFASTNLTAAHVGKKLRFIGDAYEYTISSIDTGAQTAVITPVAVNAHTTAEFAVYGDANIVYWSEANYPENFPTVNFMTIGEDDGDELTGGAVLQGQRILFKNNYIYSIPGDPPERYGHRLLHRGLGTPTQFTVDYYKDSLVFFTGNNVAVLGPGGYQYIGDKISPELEALDAGRKQYAFGKVFKDNYYLAVSETSETENNVVYKYSFRFNFWMRMRYGMNINYFAIMPDATGEECLYAGDYTGFVYKLESGLNDGAGLTGTHTGTATSATSNTLTDSGAAFFTTGDGLKAVPVSIVDGTGAGQTKIIDSNTANVLTIVGTWDVTPDNTSVYEIGRIRAYWKTPLFDGGDPSEWKRVNEATLTILA